MLPEMEDMGGGYYVFMQDGAKPHTARATLDYLKDYCPNLLESRYWPPNSPDLDPLDSKSVIENHIRAIMFVCFFVAQL